MELMQLNYDVLRCISSFLARTDLYNFVLTCRRAHRLGTPNLAAAVRLPGEPATIRAFCDFILVAPEERGRYMRKLHLARITHDPRAAAWLELVPLLVRVLAHATNLRTLILDSAAHLIHAPAGAQAVAGLPNLWRLTLERAENIAGLLEHMTCPLKDLRFTLDDKGLVPLRRIDATLEILDLAAPNATRILPATFRSTPQFPRVHTLTVRRFQTDGKSLLHHAFPHLRRLRITRDAPLEPHRLGSQKDLLDSDWGAVDELELDVQNLWLYNLVRLRARRLTLHVPAATAQGPVLDTAQRVHVLVRYLAAAGPTVLSLEVSPLIAADDYARIAQGIPGAKTVHLRLDNDFTAEDSVSALRIISEQFRALPIEYLSVTIEAPLRIRTPTAAGSVLWLYDPPPSLQPQLTLWIDSVLSAARALHSVRFVDFKWDAAGFPRTYHDLSSGEPRKLDTAHGRALRERWLDKR